PAITMTAMARELGMPVTTAADYVRAMQRRGHVRRDDHPHDSRSYVLTLTPAGRSAHKAASAAFQRAHQALLEALAPLTEETVRDRLAAVTGAPDQAIAALPRRRTAGARRQ